MAKLPRALTLVACASSVLLSCGGGGTPSPPPQYTVTVSPQPATVAAGTSVDFTATTNAPVVTWGIVGAGIDTSAGTPTSATGDTYTYTAPATPPTWGGPGIQTPGTVTIRVIPGYQTNNLIQFTFTVTAPVTVGFFPVSSTSVALGATQNFSAYAVGSTNNALTMQVNGVTNGSASVGTITTPANGFYGEYIYTAPSTMPMTGSTITIAAISQADPTKSSTLTFTLH